MPGWFARVGRWPTDGNRRRMWTRRRRRKRRGAECGERSGVRSSMGLAQRQSPEGRHEGLRNPFELWLAGGGRFNRKRRRRISGPAEVLPCWRAGIEGSGVEETKTGEPLELPITRQLAAIFERRRADGAGARDEGCRRSARPV